MPIENIKEWFVLAVPAPTNKSRAVQLGCHFEEVGEMIESLMELTPASGSMLHFADWLKKDCPGVHVDSVDRLELLDALADQIVTAVGVAHMFGLDISGALVEVNRANWSKFVDGQPVFDENGKIAKPATYTPPDLSGLI